MRILKSGRIHLISACALILLSTLLLAQPPQDDPEHSTQTPKEAAPVDLTGTWVSVIAEDWRYRMMTPPAGELQGLPLNPAAQEIMNAWDPAADEAAGLACKGYAAPNLMRLPGRARISWEDEATLKIEYDTGEQTRLLNFGGMPPTDGERTWQGYSVAQWILAPIMPRGIGFGPGRAGGPAGVPTGPLQVTTTNLREGYLRKNGVPFSENALLTEYFIRRTDIVSGDEWFSVVSVVEDPEYLTGMYIRSSEFKKEADDSMWSSRPCSAR